VERKRSTGDPTIPRYARALPVLSVGAGHDPALAFARLATWWNKQQRRDNMLVGSAGAALVVWLLAKTKLRQT